MLSRSDPLAQTSWSTRPESISSRTSTARYYETAQWRASQGSAEFVGPRVAKIPLKCTVWKHGMFLVAAGDMLSKLSLIPCNNILHVSSTIRLAKRRLRGFQLSITDGSVRNSAMCLGLFAGTHSSYGIDVPWHTQARQTIVYFHYTTLH